ncbi:sugar O-acetyltransferase [Ligilactobacillus cholophilus]|uniref:sugar O-acetyltransferase n=1 Tax=Ligilactobacillus cholophilus TaxID=3050131 RepID=UPI003EB986E4
MKQEINNLITNQKIFDETSSIIITAHQHALKICAQYNSLVLENQGYDDQLLRNLFHHVGTDLYIEPNFNCQFGFNIDLGNEVFLNHDCTLQDFAPIIIGNQANIAPRVGFYTASAVPQKNRSQHAMIAKPIILQDNVWIGGNAVILGGVTIGKNSIIGAGSVVNTDIPANSIAVGNPAKVIRTI